VILRTIVKRESAIFPMQANTSGLPSGVSTWNTSTQTKNRQKKPETVETNNLFPKNPRTPTLLTRRDRPSKCLHGLKPLDSGLLRKVTKGYDSTPTIPRTKAVKIRPSHQSLRWKELVLQTGSGVRWNSSCPNGWSMLYPRGCCIDRFERRI